MNIVIATNNRSDIYRHIRTQWFCNVICQYRTNRLEWLIANPHLHELHWHCCRFPHCSLQNSPEKLQRRAVSSKKTSVYRTLKFPSTGIGIDGHRSNSWQTWPFPYRTTWDLLVSLDLHWIASDHSIAALPPGDNMTLFLHQRRTWG